MTNTLKSKKTFTKATLLKLRGTAEEVANIIMIDSLAKKTVDAIEDGRKKINGIAQFLMFIKNNEAVISLARISKNMKIIAENEVKRNQVWSALDEHLAEYTEKNQEESPTD